MTSTRKTTTNHEIKKSKNTEGGKISHAQRLIESI
jgi:hypothetical protein